MKFILGLFIIAAALIVGIVLMVRRDPSPDVPQTVSQRVDLTDYASTSATATYVIEGKLNSEEEHRAIRISVNRNSRTLDILSGYNQTVVQTQTLPNTQSAYEEFLYALENAGFSSSQEARYSSEKGVCPLGTRYLYEFSNEGDDLLSLWSTTCSKSDGPFAGNASLIRRLFQNQMPDYRTFTKDVRL